LANRIDSTCGCPQSDGFRKGSTHPTLYGFAKNERDNIDDKQLKTLREIATGWLAVSIEHIEKEIAAGRLQEVPDGK